MIYGIVGLESELFTIYPLSVLNHNSIKPNYLCYTLSVYILYPFCDIVGLDRRFISVASPFCSYPLSGFFFTITFMIFPPFIFKEDMSSLLLRFADVSTLRSWLTGAFYTSTLFLNWNSSENRTNTDTEREREKSEWVMAGGVLADGGPGKRAHLYEHRFTAYLAFTCVVGALGGSLFGYDLGVSGLFSFLLLQLVCVFLYDLIQGFK